MSEIKIIPLADIMIGKRVRPSYQDQVAALATSIEIGAATGIGHDGLRMPIEVYAQGDGYVLISGLNRVRAHEHLERTAIAALVLAVDDVMARQLELEENLVRAELTKLDRAMFVAGYRDMFEAENGEIARGGAPEFSPRSWQTPNVGVWSKDAPKRLSMSIQAIERCLQIAKGLHPDVPDMLRGTGWDDNQKALLELASVPVEQQKAVVDILLDEGVAAATMREAIAMAAGAEPPAEKDEDERWFRKSTAILTAHKRLRRRFFAEALNKDFELLRETAEENGFALELVKGWKG